MKSVTVALFTILSVSGGIAQVKKGAPKPKTATKTVVAANPFRGNNDSVSYAVGVRIAQSLKAQGFEHVNMALFQKGINDATIGKTPALSEAAIADCMGRFQQKVTGVKKLEQQKENALKGAPVRQAGEAFLAQNGKRAGVITLPSGLQYEIIIAGTDNTRPTLASKVKCHYTGTLIDGTKFDSSVDRGEPITFPLGNVIRGWQEALQLMTVGSKWKLYIPADLAYGDDGPPPIGPGATLIFDVELLGIEN